MPGMGKISRLCADAPRGLLSLIAAGILVCLLQSCAGLTGEAPVVSIDRPSPTHTQMQVRSETVIRKEPASMPAAAGTMEKAGRFRGKWCAWLSWALITCWDKAI